jgi:membrane protein YqaA with SNARE-associated domain
VFGYLIGSALYESVGRPILELYGYMDHYSRLGEMYSEHLVLALGSAGFTPIPYKVFTIAAGAFHVPFVAFVVISAVSRGARFFLVAGLIRAFGEPIRVFIEKYFNLLTIVFVVLLVGGFLAVKLFLS